MARLSDRTSAALLVSREAERREIIDWYKARLAASRPPDWGRFQPVRIGPTWRWDPVTGWDLPEHTMGWDRLAWAGLWLTHQGRPWVYTLEQARFLLWYDALDDSGTLLTHSAAFQRLKGHGKDPLAATVALTAALAPVVFDRWARDGSPVGKEDPDAWVRVVAVSQEQTRTTMKLFPGLVPAATRRRFGVQIGKLSVWALGDTRQIEAVTSSPLALEGARVTQVIRNETQNWVASNGGLEMAATIEGDAAKRPRDQPARVLDIFNAYRPGRGSVAEATREAFEKSSASPNRSDGEAGPKFMDWGLLYDSLEAPPDAPLTAAAAPDVLRAVMGDSKWLDADRILKSILDPRNPPSESRRKWYNQITAAEDAWLTRQQVDRIADTSLLLEPGEDVVMFGDGSKSDDATGLVVCRLSDGAVFTVGVWQRPPSSRGSAWVVPRARVDAVVRRVFRDQRVRGFWFDQSHVRDDETQERFFGQLMDAWHRDYGRSLRLWARSKRSADGGHSVDFDMSKRVCLTRFVDAVPTVEADVDAKAFKFDADPRMRVHLLNARRIPSRYGMTVGKDHRESPRKIDLAVCLIGARLMRQTYLNSKPRGGWVG